MLLTNVLVEAVLQVLALIAIILTAGFLIFFIGDLVLAVLDPKYESILKRGKKKEKKEDQELIQSSNQQKQISYDSQEKSEDKLTLQNVDYDKAKKEEESLTTLASESPDSFLSEEEKNFKKKSFEMVKERNLQPAKKNIFDEENFDENFFNFNDDDDDDDDDDEPDNLVSQNNDATNLSKKKEIAFAEVDDDDDEDLKEVERLKDEFEKLKLEIIDKLKQEGNWDD